MQSLYIIAKYKKLLQNSESMIYYKCKIFVWDNKAESALEARAVQRRNLMRVHYCGWQQITPCEEQGRYVIAGHSAGEDEEGIGLKRQYKPVCLCCLFMFSKKERRKTND
jgi:hypothetical protein